MGFDEIYVLTAVVYYIFYYIHVEQKLYVFQLARIASRPTDLRAACTY